MQTSSPQFDGSELEWLAFRYIAGELSETEAAQFEERLAVDQAAREAVASSVELTSAVAAACKQLATASVLENAAVARRNVAKVRPLLTRSRSGLLTTAAALAILVWGLSWHRLQRNASDESLANVEQLVTLWSEDQRDLEPVNAVPTVPNVEPETPKQVASTQTNTPESKTTIDANDDQGDAERDDHAAPDWMLAGVSLEMNKELKSPEKGVR